MKNQKIKAIIIKSFIFIGVFLTLMLVYGAGATFGLPNIFSNKNIKIESKNNHDSSHDDEPLSYYVMEEPMTLNIKNTDHLVQIQLAFSGRGGAQFTEGLKEHEAAIRSALLMLLGDLHEEDFTTAQNKKNLLIKMRIATNRALKEAEFEKQIAQVHYISLVIQ